VCITVCVAMCVAECVAVCYLQHCTTTRLEHAIDDPEILCKYMRKFVNMYVCMCLRVLVYVDTCMCVCVHVCLSSQSMIPKYSVSVCASL